MLNTDTYTCKKKNGCISPSPSRFTRECKVTDVDIRNLNKQTIPFFPHNFHYRLFFCAYWAALLKKSGVRMYSWDYLDLIDNESYIIDEYFDLDLFFHVLTRRKRLLKLVSLRLVLNNKSIKVARTSNLKLDRIRVLLNASGFIYNCMWVCTNKFNYDFQYLHLASFLRAISRNSLISLICLGYTYMISVIHTRLNPSAILPSRYECIRKEKGQMVHPDDYLFFLLTNFSALPSHLHYLHLYEDVCFRSGCRTTKLNRQHENKKEKGLTWSKMCDERIRITWHS